MQFRVLGKTSLSVSVVAMGCWPISGITSLDVNREDSLATLCKALECGINFFDTAWSYGISEELIREAFSGRRDEVVIATKGGLDRDGKRQFVDGRPDVIRRHCEGSLKRLGTDRVELYYLHAPDPAVPVADTAGVFRELLAEGKILSAGASNLSLQQLEEFHQVCPLTAIQPAYNMLLRDIEQDIVPWCLQQQVSVCCYWPLMKGLLAGHLSRQHVFDEADGRKKYPMFQGREWEKNQDFVDELRVIANDIGTDLATMVTAWTIRQPAMTSALCGAKRAWQIEESARAGSLTLSDATLTKIAGAIERRGQPVTRAAV